MKFRIPFPNLFDLESQQSYETYKKFISEKIKTALEFPNYKSCYVNQTITLPKSTKWEEFKIKFFMISLIYCLIFLKVNIIKLYMNKTMKMTWVNLKC